jgi:hypothetical protein
MIVPGAAIRIRCRIGCAAVPVALVICHGLIDRTGLLIRSHAGKAALRHVAMRR